MCGEGIAWPVLLCYGSSNKMSPASLSPRECLRMHKQMHDAYNLTNSKTILQADLLTCCTVDFLS